MYENTAFWLNHGLNYYENTAFLSSCGFGLERQPSMLATPLGETRMKVCLIIGSSRRMWVT